MPSPDYIREFVESLPPAYARRFDEPARCRHAELAHERGLLPANLGTFEDPQVDATALCVVANDRPGLLASISAALVMCDLDVIAAEAFTRRTPAGQNEAVDIFWVRSTDVEQRDARITDESARDLLTTLNDMLSEGRPRSILPPRVEAPASTRSTSQTVVRFMEGEDGSLSTLEVETDDRSGLLLALSRALYDEQVQIVSSEVRTAGNRVLDRFAIVELDDSPITPARRLQIQVAILGAIETTYPRA